MILDTFFLLVLHLQSGGNSSCPFHRAVTHAQASPLEWSRHLKFSIVKHIQIKHDDTNSHPQTTPSFAFSISINGNSILQGTQSENKQTENVNFLDSSHTPSAFSKSVASTLNTMSRIQPPLTFICWSPCLRTKNFSLDHCHDYFMLSLFPSLAMVNSQCSGQPDP